MNFTTEIKQYISQLKTNSGNMAGVQEQTRTENILNTFCNNHMQGLLKTWPNENDYNAFRATINKPDNPKFATENINRVKKFFAWLTLQQLEESKLHHDECMQCFTVLECADLGLDMNRAVAILKDIYVKIVQGDKWTPANEEEIRTLLGFTIHDDTTLTGLSYLHTNDLNTVNIEDKNKARKVFFTWLKGLKTYRPDPSRFCFNFKEQYEYALAIIKERLIILKAKNPITIDINATDSQTPAMPEYTQPDLSHEAEESSQHLDDGTSSEISQSCEAESTAPIEPEIITDNTNATADIETWPEADKPAHVEENTNHAPIKKKPGRKVLDTVNGSKKSEKLMMYFTPELIARVRIWCDMKGISNVSFITGLVEDFLKDKEDKINAFLKLRSEL